MPAFGPRCYTLASTTPVFSDSELETVYAFLAVYPFAVNNLGYSKRILNGIKYRGVYVGRESALASTAPFERCVKTMVQMVKKEFQDNKLDLLSLEYSNQSFAHKSSWHVDLNDGYPYLNIFFPLDDVDERNGMTTLRQDGEIIELRAARNTWYSFDGSITHCAGAASVPGTPRRILLAVFRRSCDPEPVLAATSTYRAILTRRSRAKTPRLAPSSSSKVQRVTRHSLASKSQSGFRPRASRTPQYGTAPS